MTLLPSLERTLHGKVKPFITKCSLAAITARHAVTRTKSTSPSARTGRPPYLPPPTELPLRHCDHGDRGILDESECLLELVSSGAAATVIEGLPAGQGRQPKNREHYIIATADAEAGEKIAPTLTGQKRKRGVEKLDVRSVAREVPGVPIIYVKRSVMILEELSSASLGVRRREEREKMAEGIMAGKRKSTEDKGDDEDNTAAPTGVKRRGLNKAKGPNPLSVKKKKVKTQVNGVKSPENPVETGSGDGESDKPKAKRRRKHTKKSVADSDVANATAEVSIES